MIIKTPITKTLRVKFAIDPDLRHRFDLKCDAANNLEIALEREAMGETAYAEKVFIEACNLETLAFTY